MPFRYLHLDYPQHQWQLSLIDPDNDIDVAWLYGCLYTTNLSQFMTWKRQGKKLVFGLDDLIWQFPEWRRDRIPDECRTMVEVLCEVADHLVASTPELVGPMGHPEKTTVAPNLLEVDSYNLPTPPTDDGRIRILWSGAESHKGDLDLIDGPCHRVLQKYGNRVEFIFLGAGPDRTLRDWWGRGAKLVRWQDLSFYWDTVRHFKPHICLAPLVDCPFNRAKSSIRPLEAHSINAALVYSPVAEYAAVNRDGVTGLSAHTEDEWFDRICRLVDDRELRESLAAAAYTQCRSEWDWASEGGRRKWKPTVEAVERLLS